MRLYYLHDGYKEHGPYQLHELPKAMLTSKTSIWYEGIENWTAIDNIPEVATLIKTPPPFNTEPNYAMPPPFTSQPLYEPEQKAKRKWLTPALVGGAVIFGIIGYLFTANKAQAEAISSMQAEQVLEKEEKEGKEEERQRINRRLTERNMKYRNNWYEYITASPNAYRYNNLGGIYDLEVVVNNTTAGMLDEVVVYVSYIKANGDIWKTTEVPVSNIPASSTKSVAVPDVERGTSVEMHIKSIVSKKLHFYYAEGYTNGNPEDPFFNK